MRNLLFTVSFDGAPFHGWQLQTNAVSVQGTLRDAWKAVTGEQANLIGCSRTDAGVHAKSFCFNVHTQSRIPIEKFPAALRSKLPPSIAVYDCREVPAAFHARYDCHRKEYEYRIQNASVLSPFLVNRVCLYPFPLDEKLLGEACRSFVGVHDFSAFCASGSSVKDKTREVYAALVERTGDTVTFRVSANGFLYNMVRIMAGTLFGVAEGKIAPDEIGAIIDSRCRERAGVTAPPEGLYLNSVYYEDSVLREGKSDES